MIIIGVCIVFILIIIIVIVSIFWWLSYWVIFAPSRKIIWEPDQDKTPYLDLYLPIADNRKGEVYNANCERPVPCINIWHFNQFSKKMRGHCSSTVLYFHGNSGNISYRNYVVDICQRLGLNLVLVDYRGYGRSDGVVSPEGIYQDGEVAYNYLTGMINSEDIIVWGESLGSTVACYIASTKKCRALVILAGFSSLEDVISNSGYPEWLSSIFSKMLRLTFHPMESKLYLKDIKCKVAIMHSKTDSLIPFQSGQILFNSVPHCYKQFFTIKGDHASPDIPDSVLETLLAFVDVQSVCIGKQISHITKTLHEVCEVTPELLVQK